MEYAVETFSLTKIFSDRWGRNKVFAVDDLNLKVRSNEVFGLLGPNGSGKTTTLKVLLGLLHPTKGRAFCLGGDATAPEISARIGFLPEESYLYRYLTARETLDFYGSLFHLPAKVRKTRTEALLDMVGLKGVANRQVGTFSKGMARRIGLAQALINDPDLLILDEPTTGLDPIGTRQIKDLILELAKRGKTVLLCSHLLADVEDMCDRISILYGGKIQAEGRVRELLQQPDKTEIMTGRLSESAIRKIQEIAEQENATCAVTSPMDKLESFFINIVSEAQQQALPTSGAESGTEISDFLSVKGGAKAGAAGVLDKLVSADVGDQGTERPQSPATQQPTPIERPEQKPDDALLRELTQQSQPAAPKPVTPEQSAPEKTEVESSDGMKKDILDELAGGLRPERDSEPKEKRQGDA